MFGVVLNPESYHLLLQSETREIIGGENPQEES